MELVMLVAITHEEFKKAKTNDRLNKIKNNANICSLTYNALEKEFSARDITFGQRRDFAIRECVKYLKQEKTYVPKCNRNKTGPKYLLNSEQIAMIIAKVRVNYLTCLQSQVILSAALTQKALSDLVREVDERYQEKVNQNHYSRFYLNVTLKKTILSAIFPVVVSPENESILDSAVTIPSSPVGRMTTLAKERTDDSSDSSSSDADCGSDEDSSGSDDEVDKVKVL